VLKVTSRPWEVGTLVLANAPPPDREDRGEAEPARALRIVRGDAAGERVLGRVAAADRHAKLPPPFGAVGSDTDPAGPSTVLSWNGWLNRTVPAASALGAAAMATVISPITSMTATAHDIIRRTSRALIITRLLFRIAGSVPRADRPADADGLRSRRSWYLRSPIRRTVGPAGRGGAGRLAARDEGDGAEDGDGRDEGQAEPGMTDRPDGTPRAERLDGGRASARGEPARQGYPGLPGTVGQAPGRGEGQVSRLAGSQADDLLRPEGPATLLPGPPTRRAVPFRSNGRSPVLSTWTAMVGQPLADRCPAMEATAEVRRRGPAAPDGEVDADPDPGYLVDPEAASARACPAC